MALRLRCELCRIDLAPGATHCPRCARRLAPLERRSAGARAREPAAPGPAAGPAGAARPRPGSGPPARWAVVALRGGLIALALLAVAALGALYFRTLRGSWLGGLGDAAGITGGLTLGGAALAGRFELLRWVHDPATLRDRARGLPSGGGARRRLSVAIAGLMLLAVSAAAAAAAR